MYKPILLVSPERVIRTSAVPHNVQTKPDTSPKNLFILLTSMPHVVFFQCQFSLRDEVGTAESIAPTATTSLRVEIGTVEPKGT